MRIWGFNNPSGPQWANEWGVWAQDPVINSSTSLYLKNSMPLGMKNSLQREYTALVLWQEGKEERRFQTHTQTHTHTYIHTFILCGSVKCAAKITGCQAVFTVFFLPGGLFSLGLPRLSSSLLHKYITFLLFPSSTWQLKLVLTGW